MGNCLFGGLGEEENEVVKVITSNGGVMEFYEATTAESITDEFPGHAIFRSKDLFWNPIPHKETLVAGNSYYLLPLPLINNKPLLPAYHRLQIGHIRSNSEPPVVAAAAAHCSSPVAPYRMSFSHRGRKLFKKTWSSSLSLPSTDHDYSEAEAGSGVRRFKQSNKNFINKYVATSSSCGIWKVKLVISPQQLVEILSQEVRTQELIESIRTVAKCGKTHDTNRLPPSSDSAFSDHWSLHHQQHAGVD